MTGRPPAQRVTVSNESDVPCDEARLQQLASYLFAELRLHPECELGITLVDVERMSTLHEDWMHEPGPTDVLSFPIDELVSAPAGTDPEPGILGDIVLCPAFIGPQARAADRTLQEEMEFLTTHGMLHLIGYDHMTDDEYDAMFALQDDLLRGWWAA